MHVKDACKLNPQPGQGYAFVSPEVVASIARGVASRVVVYIRENVPIDIGLDVAYAISRDMQDNKMQIDELTRLVEDIVGGM